jgi:hypothetical protein
MKKSGCNYHTQTGSSLIGIALLTVVMGALMTGGIYLLQNYQTIKSDQRTTDVSVILEKAVDDFVAINKRYPCPTRLSVAPNDPNFGLEDCTIVDIAGRDSGVKIGAAPVRSLNVPDKMMVDGYGKRHIYAVSSDLTATSPLPDLNNTLGQITILDESGESLSTPSGYVTFAFISPGEDDRGAYDVEGNEIMPCGAAGSSEAAQNCDFADATFAISSKKSFRGEATDFTHRFAYQVSAPAYNWHTQAWSDCGSDASGTEWTSPRPICFSSEQERNVTCKDKDGNDVDAAEESNPDRCGHTPKPVTLRACSLGPCSWDVAEVSCPISTTPDPIPEPDPVCITEFIRNISDHTIPNASGDCTGGARRSCELDGGYLRNVNVRDKGPDPVRGNDRCHVTAECVREVCR